MRLREFLFGTALMSIALVTSKAAAPTVVGDEYRSDFPDNARSIGEARVSVPPPTPPSPLISRDKVLASAYYDTLSILRSNNPCSDFFGGPDAVEIFDELVSKIRKDALSAHISMRMSGRTTNIHNARTKKHFRSFDKVSLNTRGSFYRKSFGNWEATVPRIGTFQPNTKEARVLILLHELGHVTKGSDGQWLLPDDGKDEGLSRANSDKIEDVCANQIHSLGKAATMKDLGKYKDPEPKPVPLSTNERTKAEPLQ